MTDILELPKPQFKPTKILFEACVAQGVSAIALSSDRADTVMRAMKNNQQWSADNQNIIKLYMSGSDEWMDLIKSVRKYAVEFSKYQRSLQRAQTKANKQTNATNL